MSTKITHLNHPWAISGANNKHIAESPSGRLWVAIYNDGENRIKFFWSENQGATWSYSSKSDIKVPQNYTIPSIFIDADGYMHVVWMHHDGSPQNIHYYRGHPSSDGRNFYFGGDDGEHTRHTFIFPSAGRIGKDCDVVAFRRGTGWDVWISWEFHDVGHRLSRLSVSANGTVTIAAATIDPGNSTVSRPFNGLEFNHNGDGITPNTDPHVFLYGAAMGGSAVRIWRGSYASGAWTWDKTVLLESVTVGETTMVGVWDGALLNVAWTASGTKVVRFATWDGSAATATRYDPPAAPAGWGTINGMSMTHDPVTDDIYLVAHDVTDGDIYYVKFTRATNTWGAWTQKVTRTAWNLDNKVQSLRHSRYGNVDILYANYTADFTGIAYHARVLSLTRAPGTPSLVSPANGARGELSNGATFAWKYNTTIPGDKQQAWAFRRTFSATTEYWNAASQAWQSTEIFNSGEASQAVFGAAKWTAGTTYAWTVRTRSSTGVNSDYAPERTVVATAAPVVVVNEPLGVIFGESTPLIQWSYTAVEAQRDYEIRIVQTASGIDPLNPGPSVWASGVTTSAVARERRTDVSLAFDTSYRAYVRATSTAGVASEWTYAEFSLSSQPPPSPLVGVIEEWAYPSDVPHARLNVQARTNYMSADQSEGLLGWEALSNCTVSAQAQDLVELLAPSLKMTSTASGVMSAKTVIGTPPTADAALPQPLGPLDFPVRGNEVYTAVAFLRHNTAARAARVSIQWEDNEEGGGSVVGTNVGEQVNLTTSSYTLAFVTATAPPTAELGRVIIEGLGTAAAGEILYSYKMSFHPGAVADWTPGGFAERQTIRVERSDDWGVSWVQITDRIRTDYWQRAVIRDRTMPLNRSVRYRAYTDDDLDNGNFLTSQVSPESVLEIASEDWVIRDPLDEHAEEFVFVVGHDQSDTEALTVHRPAGRTYPVIDTEGFQSGEGTLEVFVPAHKIDDVTALLQRSATLLVQSPAGRTWHVRVAKRDYAVEASRHRTISVPYFEVDPSADLGSAGVAH